MQQFKAEQDTAEEDLFPWRWTKMNLELKEDVLLSSGCSLDTNTLIKKPEDRTLQTMPQTGQERAVMERWLVEDLLMKTFSVIAVFTL